jgi:hypothetical protein
MYQTTTDAKQLQITGAHHQILQTRTETETRQRNEAEARETKTIGVVDHNSI